MGKKFDRCVKKVSKANIGKPKKKRVNPFAVCTAALNK